MTVSEMRRREFLLITLVTLAAAGCSDQDPVPEGQGGDGGVGGGPGDPAGLSSRLLDARAAVLAYFGDADPDALGEIVEHYLDQEGVDPTRELFGLVESALQIIEESDDVGQAVENLLTSVRAEHRRLQFVSLAGWVLSPTELGAATILYVTTDLE